VLNEGLAQTELSPLVARCQLCLVWVQPVTGTTGTIMGLAMDMTCHVYLSH
jgi:hypothetical protein